MRFGVVMEIGHGRAFDGDLIEHQEALRRRRREYLQLRLAQVQHALRWGARLAWQPRAEGPLPSPQPDLSALEALRVTLSQRLAAEG